MSIAHYLLGWLLLNPGACLPAADPAGTSGAGGPYEILIVNGRVLDGTGREPRQANIGIYGDTIVAVDAPDETNAAVIIDAAGMLVTPGFIDPHTHTLGDLLSPATRMNMPYLTQGVTTVFVGNDGGGVPDRQESLALLEQQGIGTNLAFFAGHNHIRYQVMAGGARQPSNRELNDMRRLVEEEMEAGALGLSTGLFYPPGSYADTEEVVELARVAARSGGIYETHLRDESTYSVGLLAAIEETLEIGSRAGLPVHIAHIKALGRDVRGLSDEVTRTIERAKVDGILVSADLYPWEASSTRLSNVLVPRWAMAGSADSMRARLRDEAQRTPIRQAMLENLRRRNGADAILVTQPGHAYAGKTLRDIADELESDPIDAAISILVDSDPSIASFVMSRNDIETFAVQPWVMFASDGTDGHPRKYATYPKAYADFVLAGALIDLPEFVRKSTGLVADTFRLCRRGYIRVGYAADVVVIAPQQFAPVADYENPELFSAGVRHVIVNGSVAVKDGEPQRNTAGRVLRKTGSRCAQDSGAAR